MEGEDTGWLSELEKKGLHQVSGILENYGIDSETDVSLLDQGDLRNLVSQGLKPMQLKKLERWCDSVCHTCREDVFVFKYPDSSSTTQFRRVECADSTSTLRHRGGICVRP